MKNIKIGVSLGNKDKLQEELNSLGKNAQIKIDLTETNASLKTLIDSINNMNSKLKNLDFSVFDKLGVSAEDVRKKVQQTTDSLKDIDNKVTKIKVITNAKEEKSEILEFKQSYSQTAKQVVKDGETISSSVSTNFEKLNKKTYEFQEALNRLEKNGLNVDK